MTGSADGVLANIGEIGRWQVRQSAVLSTVGVLCGWHALVINFLAPPTGHWCAPPNSGWSQAEWRRLGIPPEHGTGADELSQCRSYIAEPASPSVDILGTNSTIPCNRWTYNTSEYSSSIITEWDLVCDRKWLQMLTQAIYMTGVMFGVMFWGILSDRFGRRPCLLACILLSFCTSCGSAAVNSFQTFLGLRFLMAFAGIGAYVSSFVICMEMIGDRWRGLLGTAFCLPMSFGFMTLSVIAYFIRDWRMLLLATSLPAVAYFSFYWFVPESPRWLLSRGRVAEAKEIIQKIRRYNNMPPLEKLTFSQDRPEHGPVKREGWLDIVTNWRMMALCLCLFFCWFVNSLVFYGILLNAGDFGDDIYLNAFLGGLVELPAYAMCAYAIYRLGRRLPISCTMVLAGVSCLLTIFCEKGQYVHDWPIVTLAMLGKFCITASFSTIYIYTSELFPTAMRNTGLALCNAGSRLGGILAPFLILLRDAVHPAAPAALFCVTAVASGLSILLLPETADRPMPETTDDVFPRRNRGIVSEETHLNSATHSGGASDDQMR